MVRHMLEMGRRHTSSPKLLRLQLVYASHAVTVSAYMCPRFVLHWASASQFSGSDAQPVSIITHKRTHRADIFSLPGIKPIHLL